MPLILPPDLPAIGRLRQENILLPTSADEGEDALQVVLLNLMPFKEETETDLVRVMRGVSQRVRLSLMSLSTHTPTHTSREHMQAFYTPFPDLREQYFDGMIITGAPVEHLAFEDVNYWEEMADIFRWAPLHVRSTLYVCWAAQAVLYFAHHIDKVWLPQKRFGVFPQTILQPSVDLLRGIPDKFTMPHSRHTELLVSELDACKALTPLATNDETGHSLLYEHEGREIYVMGHLEYPAATLHHEYCRDLGKRDDVGIPKNYYTQDDPSRPFHETWSAVGRRFYENWITHYVSPR